MKLINYQYLRNECDCKSAPDDKLDNPIKRAQDMLQMVIGDDLFNEIAGQYPNSFTALNTALMEYIKPFLAWQGYQFYLPKANFLEHVSGMRVHSEDNSVAATDAQMATLIRDAKMWCQTKKEKLVQYLEDNHESYPLYDFWCNKNKRTGTGFHITAVGTKHRQGCTCDICCNHGH